MIIPQLEMVALSRHPAYLKHNKIFKKGIK